VPDLSHGWRRGRFLLYDTFAQQLSNNSLPPHTTLLRLSPASPLASIVFKLGF
jgi:hypothetical protein